MAAAESPCHRCGANPSSQTIGAVGGEGLCDTCYSQFILKKIPAFFAAPSDAKRRSYRPFDRSVKHIVTAFNKSAGETNFKSLRFGPAPTVVNNMTTGSKRPSESEAGEPTPKRMKVVTTQYVQNMKQLAEEADKELEQLRKTVGKLEEKSKVIKGFLSCCDSFVEGISNFQE